MWHKAIWKGHPMRPELTRVGLLVELANHYTTTGAFVYVCVCVCVCVCACVSFLFNLRFFWFICLFVCLFVCLLTSLSLQNGPLWKRNQSVANFLTSEGHLTLRTRQTYKYFFYSFQIDWKPRVEWVRISLGAPFIWHLSTKLSELRRLG